MSNRQSVLHRSSIRRDITNGPFLSEKDIFRYNCGASGSLSPSVTEKWSTASLSIPVSFPEVTPLDDLQKSFASKMMSICSTEKMVNQQESHSPKHHSASTLSVNAPHFPKILSLTELRKRLALKSTEENTTESVKSVEKKEGVTEPVVFPSDGLAPAFSSACEMPSEAHQVLGIQHAATGTRCKDEKANNHRLSGSGWKENDESVFSLFSSSKRPSLLDLIRDDGAVNITVKNAKQGDNEKWKKRFSRNSVETTMPLALTPTSSGPPVAMTLGIPKQGIKVALPCRRYSTAMAGESSLSFANQDKNTEGSSCSGWSKSSRSSSGGTVNCKTDRSGVPCKIDSSRNSSSPISSTTTTSFTSSHVPHQSDKKRTMESSPLVSSSPAFLTASSLRDRFTSPPSVEEAVRPLSSTFISAFSSSDCHRRRRGSNASSTSSSSNEKSIRATRKKQKLDVIPSAVKEMVEREKKNKQGVLEQVPLTFDSSPRCLVFDTSSFLRADTGILNMCAEKYTVCVPYAVLHEIDMQIKHGSFGRRPANTIVREEKNESTSTTNFHYSKFTLTDDQLKGQAIKVRDWIHGAQQSDRGIRVQRRSEVNETYFRSALSNDDHILGFAVFLKDESMSPTYFITEDKLLTTKAVAELGRNAVCTYESLRARMGVRIRGKF